MKLAVLRGLMFMVLGLPVALAQAMPFSQEGPSCPLPGDEMVKPLENQCLDPGNGGSAVCGSYNCFTKCEVVTVQDCTLRWACIAGATLCILYGPVYPYPCMATVFVCNAFGWINEYSQRQEERCRTYCVR
jgi:hypothetical protein